MSRRLRGTARTETIFDRGDPVGRIREIVDEQGIDVVIASTRHEDVKHRFYTGPTVARRLLHTAPCSIALVRVVHLGRIHPREILVPLRSRIDRLRERASLTAMLARALDATVHFFHSAAPGTAPARAHRLSYSFATSGMSRWYSS